MVLGAILHWIPILLPGYFLFLVYFPGLPPTVKFEEFSVDKALPLTGPLETNNFLDSAERLLEDKYQSLESLASNNDNDVYASTRGGEVIKIYGENYSQHKVIAKFKTENCGSDSCGRPLGIKFHKDGRLYITHTTDGIYALDVNNGKVELVVDAKIPTDDTTGRWLNSVEFDNDGNIYWTESSTAAPLEEGVTQFLTGPTGRLMRYNPKTKVREVLMKKLMLPNGIQKSPKGDFIILSETAGRRILRYWIKGAKKGTNDTFISNLPGMPDNITPRKEGGYYIPILSLAPQTLPDFYKYFSVYYNPRTVFVRTFGLGKLFADVVEFIFPNQITSYMSKQALGSVKTMFMLRNSIEVVVEVDENGKIVGSLQGKSGKVKSISEVNRIGNNLFIGSPFESFVGKLSLSKLEQLKKEHKAKAKSSKEEL